MENNDIIKLVGKSRHGKNRVRERGELWRIHRIAGDRLCIIAESDKTGFAGGGTDWSCPDSIRWISEKADLDFEIVKE